MRLEHLLSGARLRGAPGVWAPPETDGLSALDGTDAGGGFSFRCTQSVATPYNGVAAIGSRTPAGDTAAAAHTVRRRSPLAQLVRALH